MSHNVKDKAGYPYVKFQDSDTFHRQRYDQQEIPSEFQQGGGRSVEDTERLMHDPAARNPLRWKKFVDDRDGVYYKWDRPSWYEHLDPVDEYITQKCAAKHALTDEQRSILDAWGPKWHRYVAPDAPEENQKLDPAARTVEDLSEDVRGPVDDYNADKERAAEIQTYENCDLTVNLDRLDIAERLACSDLVCRNQLINDKWREDLRMHSMDDLDKINASDLSERVKKQYARCAEKGYFCTSQDVVTYEYELFKHFHNRGSGDCLFVAFAHYQKVAAQLGYQTPGNPTMTAQNYRDLDYWVMGNREHSVENKRIADELRAGVVEWFRANPDFYYAAYNHGLWQHMTYLLATEPEHGIVSVEHALKHRVFTRSQKAVLRKHFIIDNNSLLLFVNSYWDRVTQGDDPVELGQVFEIFANLYINHMSKPATYAGPLEILALFKLHNVNITVLCPSVDGYLTYRTTVSSPDNDNTMYIINTEACNNAAQQVNFGTHYEIIFPWDQEQLDFYSSIGLDYRVGSSLDDIAEEHAEQVIPSLTDNVLDTAPTETRHNILQWIDTHATEEQRGHVDELLVRFSDFNRKLTRIVNNRYYDAVYADYINAELTRDAPVEMGQLRSLYQKILALPEEIESFQRRGDWGWARQLQLAEEKWTDLVDILPEAAKVAPLSASSSSATSDSDSELSSDDDSADADVIDDTLTTLIHQLPMDPDPDYDTVRDILIENGDDLEAADFNKHMLSILLLVSRNIDKSEPLNPLFDARRDMEAERIYAEIIRYHADAPILVDDKNIIDILHDAINGINAVTGLSHPVFSTVEESTDYLIEIYSDHEDQEPVWKELRDNLVNYIIIPNNSQIYQYHDIDQVRHIAPNTLVDTEALLHMLRYYEDLLEMNVQAEDSEEEDEDSEEEDDGSDPAFDAVEAEIGTERAETLQAIALSEGFQVSDVVNMMNMVNIQLDEDGWMLAISLLKGN